MILFTVNSAMIPLVGNSGKDELHGGSGNDVLYGDEVMTAEDPYGGWWGDDDKLYGGAGDDTLHGGFGADLLSGNAGNDTLVGGNGQDTLNGDAGNDVLSDGESDIERIVDLGYTDGSAQYVGNDIMNGGDGDDIISGKYGSNTINGGNGNDLIHMDSEGGFIFTFNMMTDETSLKKFDEFNTVTGGDGADNFRFGSIFQEDARDVITDFTKDLDRIQLESSHYSAVGGEVDANEFAYGSVATTETQHLLYNQADGALYYDADGSGSGAAVQLATVLNNGVPANLDHTSFEVV